MEKTLFDMVVEYSVKNFPELRKDLKKFENLLSDNIKTRIEKFKPFSTYEKQKDMLFDLGCDTNKTLIRCETNRYYIVLEVNTLNENKLRRMKNNKCEMCNVFNFSIENKSKEQITSYSITINKENGNYVLKRTRDVLNGLTLMPISEKQFKDTAISYLELEDIFATMTSIEVINKDLV